YPIRSKNALLKAMPLVLREPLINSDGVFDPAATNFPSTFTVLSLLDLPATKLSSVLLGTCFESNISERTSPAFEHKSDGAIPDVAQKLRLTIPSGCLKRSCGATKSGFTSVAALTNFNHRLCVRWL